MRHTKNETSTETLTRLIKALDAKHPVTITYIKADGTETLRTIEIYDIRTTKAGDIVIKAMDRESGESRTFRYDRIKAYTRHTGATYQVERPAEDTPAPTPVVRSVAAFIAYEIARDEHERLTTARTALAA